MEWKEFQISEIATLINGRAYSQDELFEKGKYKIVRVGNLSGGNKWFFSDMELDADKYCYPNDLLFSWACNFGPHIWKNDKTIYHYHIWKVKEDSSKIDKYFFYYFLKYRTPYWLGNVNGSVMVHITKGTMEKQSIRIPVNLSDQRKIAGILSALDSKIENNNKINANLEAQAEALFKSWFVDFTPFKDQPFVDSELGPIPQGWKVGKLGDYVEIKRGGSPRPIQKFLASQGLNWLKISDATSTQSPFIFNIKEKIIIDGLKKTVFLKAGSLVLSNSATPCIPKFLSIDSCIHDGWLYFPHSQLPENYLYLFFKLMRNNLVSKANGSVFLNLKTDIVKNQVFAFSGEEIYNSFDKIIAPLFNEIENLTYETFQLSALRDTLLPKLMSGEIKL